MNNGESKWGFIKNPKYAKKNVRTFTRHKSWKSPSDYPVFSYSVNACVIGSLSETWNMWKLMNNKKKVRVRKKTQEQLQRVIETINFFDEDVSL